MMLRKGLLVAGTLLLGAALSGEAAAHAFLDHANPAVGSTLKTAPGEIRLWFTEDLEGAFSTIRVVDPSGNRVDKDDKTVDSADKTLLKVSVPTLQAGSYQVNWRVLSVDGHVTQGNFKFEISP